MEEEMNSPVIDGDVKASNPESTPTRAPRLFIKEMVMRNFKSYAGEQRVGPFHKVRVLLQFFFFSFSLYLDWFQKSVVSY